MGLAWNTPAGVQREPLWCRVLTPDSRRHQPRWGVGQSLACLLPACCAEAAWLPGESDPAPEPASVASKLDDVPGTRFGENVNLPLSNSPAGLGERPKLDSRAVTPHELRCGRGASKHRDLTEPDRFHVGPRE